jgi:hypothetical protein
MSRKINALLNVIYITNIQQRMLSGYFEIFIMDKYGSYNVLNNVFKYMHYDLTNARGLRTITLTFNLNFITTFFSKTKCCVIYSHSKFWNHFQKQIWAQGFCLKGWGKHHNKLDRSISYHITICSNTFHTWIYVETILGKIGHSKGCRSSKSFILVVVNGLGPKDMHALYFFPEFYK